ncbi:MAG: hypothetical protein ACE5K3_07865 [bacterium]
MRKVKVFRAPPLKMPGYPHAQQAKHHLSNCSLSNRPLSHDFLIVTVMVRINIKDLSSS